MRSAGQEHSITRVKAFSRTVMFMAAVLSVFALLLIMLFAKLYDTGRENLIQITQNHVQATTSDINFYLDTALNALSFSKENIEQLHAGGAGKERMNESITIMTNTFAKYVDDDVADIYGYMYGDFINGHNWVPDEDYVATERDWYITAVQNRGELVTIPPYVDAESGKVCVTFARTLDDDPDSVISFDISLASLQHVIDSVIPDEAMASARIIDRQKKLIIVSDKTEEILTDYREDKRVKDAIADRNSQYTIIKSGGREYIVFISPLTTGWDYVCIYDTSKLLGSLRYLYLFSASGILLFLSVVLVIFSQMRSSRKRMNRLINLSETDALTGVFNRGSGEARINDMLEKRTKCTFLMLDVDKFKSINDTLGHDTGDKVIIAVAEMLSQCAHAKDIVMRLGGDEFVMVLAGVCDRSYAEDIADKLFRLLDAARIDGADDMKLSVSIGAAMYDGVGRADFNRLYQEADPKIYISKKTEGNMITF
ncbi:MAG: diguanylate cyclase [Oscillospiraceae bacterium]|nr:diguanylate cyclase [Oscillospiraceae bacterium]